MLVTSGRATVSDIRQVPCPICGRLAEFSPRNRWRPFCSERCRGVDLGAWASDGYRVAGSVADDGDPDESGAVPLPRQPND